MVDHAHRLRREPMSIARGGRVRASPPSCESITRSRWVGFCYSCASAPSPAGLLCVPWTGKYYRAPRPPFAHRCVPAIAAARDGSPPPPPTPPTAARRARVASIRVARSEPLASEARREAGWFRVAAPIPILRLLSALRPSALPVLARFLRSYPAPPPRPQRARAPPGEARSRVAAGPL